jgi:hypothetical protein
MATPGQDKRLVDASSLRVADAVPRKIMESLSCCLTHEIGNEDETVTIHEVDLMDMEQLKCNESFVGQAVSLNANRFNTFTGGALGALSVAYSQEDTKHISYTFLFIMMTGLASAGWYLGSSSAIIWERLSVDC